MQLGKLEVGANTPLGKSVKHTHGSKKGHGQGSPDSTGDATGATGTASPRERTELEKCRTCLISPYYLSKRRERSMLQLFFPMCCSWWQSFLLTCDKKKSWIIWLQFCEQAVVYVLIWDIRIFWFINPCQINQQPAHCECWEEGNNGDRRQQQSSRTRRGPADLLG